MLASKSIQYPSNQVIRMKIKRHATQTCLLFIKVELLHMSNILFNKLPDRTARQTIINSKPT